MLAWEATFKEKAGIKPFYCPPPLMDELTKIFPSIFWMFLSIRSIRHEPDL